MSLATTSKDRWWVTVGSWLVTAAVCWLLLELGARAYWRVSSGVSMIHPERLLEAFYPGLADIREAQPAQGDQFYDVLLLGGSTLFREAGAVEQSLHEKLAHAGYRNVRIFNLGYPAHSSRDSLLKYQVLGRARFDLVVDYDGFNDIRANNAPPAVYRADYSHVGWYDSLNRLIGYQDKARMALPYTITFLRAKMRQQGQPDRYMGRTSRPPAEWTQYGHLLRSPDALRSNLGEIATLARARGDRLVLMSFASYIPDNYSLASFTARELDYSLHYSELEIWGEPKNVAPTLAAHNRVIRELAKQNPQAVFVEQEELMRGDAGYFNDACHLTVAGSARFAANIVAALGAPQTAAPPAQSVARVMQRVPIT